MQDGIHIIQARQIWKMETVIKQTDQYISNFLRLKFFN